MLPRLSLPMPTRRSRDRPACGKRPAFSKLGGMPKGPCPAGIPRSVRRAVYPPPLSPLAHTKRGRTQEDRQRPTWFGNVRRHSNQLPRSQRRLSVNPSWSSRLERSPLLDSNRALAGIRTRYSRILTPHGKPATKSCNVHGGREECWLLEAACRMARRASEGSRGGDFAEPPPERPAFAGL